MRFMPILLVLVLSANAEAGVAPAHTDWTNPCNASSSYDLTLLPDGLRFERSAPAPRHIEWRAGRLSIDGVAARLSAEDSDRLGLFDTDLRAWVPTLKSLARSGIDLAVRSVPRELRDWGIDAATQVEVERALAARGSAIKRRIDTSVSTRDWTPEVLERLANAAIADILPLITADLERQATEAAQNGDLGSLAQLSARPARLLADGGSDELLQLLRPVMQGLRPQIDTACSSMRHFYQVQRGLRANGRVLDLLDVEPH